MMINKNTTHFTRVWMPAIALVAALHAAPWSRAPQAPALAQPPVSTSQSETQHKAQVEFGAYYTKIMSGRPFETFSRTDAYADVVVQVSGAGGRLVFWRGSSYLPCWEGTRTVYVPQVTVRKGDGDAMMPDRVNTFSHVRIIDNTPSKVLIHWRYLPEFGGTNPKTGMDATKFVDEYFTISPDGKVIRTIRQGTPNIDDWNDPLRHITQTFTLTASGIEDLRTTEPVSSPSAEAVSGNPIKQQGGVQPVAWWKFDEAQGDTAMESVSGSSATIAGHKGLWKQGVSGTALQFDGYFSRVGLPADKAPTITSALTLEAWTAIGAYPWNWAPLVQQGDDDGYFLGIDGHGYPGFKAKIGDTWLEVGITGEPPYAGNLKLYRWYHLAGTYDKAAGRMCLYIDGQLAASKLVPQADIQIPGDTIQIGKGMDRIPVDNYKKNATSYSFDGLIDEVKIYSAALSARQLARSYDNVYPGKAIVDAPDMQARVFPTEGTHGRFDAAYLKLDYHEAWDNVFRVSEHPDVVVGFDQLPTRFVFWRGMSYIPHLTNELNQWYTNEFNETWDNGGQEPMADQQSYYNHVRIIEKSPARIVVHWRYPLINTQHVIARFNPDTGWGEWCDWYWTITPDGIAAKRMRCWHEFKGAHEWHTGWPTLPPGVRPDDVMETEPFLTLIDLEGHVFDHNWDRTVRVDFSGGKNIHRVNMKGQYDPVDISDNTNGNAHYGDAGVFTWFSKFPAWNHWPISLSDSVGRPASFTDRAMHSSLIRAHPQTYAKQTGDAPFEEKLMLEGMTNLDPVALVTLARSWLQAPPMSHVSGAIAYGYSRPDRAYHLQAADQTMTFQIDASAQSPIYNPSFVIKHWGSAASQARLNINGEARPSGPNFRQGVVIDTDGTYSLIIWIDLQAITANTFEIQIR
ncbi:MAG: LamG domain-containing protein [Phycisphaerae bacterium]|nr:LamG domain-containing protein [Phycisphaerae bacterium]